MTHFDLDTLPKAPPENSAPEASRYTEFSLRFPSLPIGKTLYIAKNAGGELYFYAHIKENADNLTILLPGAAKAHGKRPEFQRHSWSDDIPGHVIAVADPTLTAENGLTIGWCQGTAACFGVAHIADTAKAAARALGVDCARLCFFGSSAGGFAALKAAELLPKSIAVAINPQIYVDRYSKRFFTEMRDYSYPNIEDKRLLAAYRDRLHVAARFEGAAPAYVFQNTADAAHLAKHSGYFYKKNPKEARRQYILENNFPPDPETFCSYAFNLLQYNDPELGHAPPHREKTLEFLRAALRYAGIIDDHAANHYPQPL